MMNNVDDFYHDRISMCGAINMHILNGTAIELPIGDDDVSAISLFNLLYLSRQSVLLHKS